jgi:hypothetical protein
VPLVIRQREKSKTVAEVFIGHVNREGSRPSKESAMTRISIICAVTGALVVFALCAPWANAGTVTIHTATPKVNVPTPKVGGLTPKLGNAAYHDTNGGQYTRHKLPGKMKSGYITLTKSHINPNAVTLPQQPTINPNAIIPPAR